MQWEFIVVLIIAIPIIVFPAAFIWYLNLGGLYAALRDRWLMRQKKEQAKTALKVELNSSDGTSDLAGKRRTTWTFN